jgi:hypothetical protein
MAVPTVTIADIRALGEAQTLEFKRSLSLVKEGFIALCAMTNAANAKGVVVFGIEPSGEVCGLGDTNLDTAQRKVALHARQRIDPPLMPEIHRSSVKASQSLCYLDRGQEQSRFMSTTVALIYESVRPLSRCPSLKSSSSLSPETATSTTDHGVVTVAAHSLV